MSWTDLPHLLDLDAAARWRAELRESDQTLAFTNGCFDILHAGHILMLYEARHAADALVVAINSDASLQRLKGEGRPIVPERERAELLLALETVDRVVLFDDATPLQCIEAIQPDVLVKGADWALDDIVGAKEVIASGGRVLRVPFESETSTSKIIDRVRERYG